MIHATIHGVLTEDAEFIGPRRSSVHSRQANATFTISTRCGGVEQFVCCRMRGQRAESIEPELAEGKRVIVSGSLRLPRGDEPARLEVDRIELVGGARALRGERSSNAL